MKPNHAPMLTLMLSAALAGCAGVGNQDFACPGYPGKPLCMSAAEVYRLTDGHELPPAPLTPLISDAPRIEDELFMEMP